MSAGPPAAKGTMIRTGLSGYGCADAAPETSATARMAKVRTNLMACGSLLPAETCHGDRAECNTECQHGCDRGKRRGEPQAAPRHRFQPVHGPAGRDEERRGLDPLREHERRDPRAAQHHEQERGEDREAARGLGRSPEGGDEEAKARGEDREGGDDRKSTRL